MQYLALTRRVVSISGGLLLQHCHLSRLSGTAARDRKKYFFRLIVIGTVVALVEKQFLATCRGGIVDIS